MDMEIPDRRVDLPGVVFCRLDHFTGHWKGPEQPLVIGPRLKVGGCGRF
jgi:hypothetical protein